MPPDEPIPPLTGAALRRARKELAAANKKVTVRWCLIQARRFLEAKPPQVFIAITHIDAALVCDRKRRRRASK
jgi:uncharacterized protein (DUF2237 family)